MFDNLSVSVKLIILNIVAAIGIIVLGFTGYSSVNSAKEDMEVMYKRYLNSIYYVARCRYSMRYAQVQMSVFPLSTDVALGNSRIQKYNSAVSDFEESLAAYEKIIGDDPDLISELAPAKAEWAEFKKTGDALMKMAPPPEALTDSNVLADHRNAAMHYYEQNGIPHAVAIGDISGEMLNKVRVKADQMMDHAIDGVNALITRTFIITAAMIAILIVFSTMIMKSVTTPLEKMVKLFGLLRGGDFRRSELIDPDRGDEFGTMSQAIRDMRETISNLIQKTSHSSEQLAASSQELTASAHQSAQASEQVAQSVTNSASAVVEQQQSVSDSLDSINAAMTSIDKLGKTADTVSSHATKANNQATVGNKAVECFFARIADDVQLRQVRRVLKFNRARDEFSALDGQNIFAEAVSVIFGEMNRIVRQEPDESVVAEGAAEDEMISARAARNFFEDSDSVAPFRNSQSPANNFCTNRSS